MAKLPLITKMTQKYSGTKMFKLPIIQDAMAAEDKFCAFCIVEAHMKGVIQEKEFGQKQVLPLSVILLVQKVGNGAFEIGR